VVVCLEQGADLHMAQLMPLPLTVTCVSKIQIGFTFLAVAHLGSPGKRAVKRVCVSSDQRRQDVFLHSFRESSFYSRTLLHAKPRYRYVCSVVCMCFFCINSCV